MELEKMEDDSEFTSLPCPRVNPCGEEKRRKGVKGEKGSGPFILTGPFILIVKAI